MARQHLVLAAESLCKALDEVDRAVLSACAADRDGKVIAVVACVVGKPARDKVMDVGVHTFDVRVTLEVSDNRGVFPGERRERGLVMRIRQAANVEDQIGVEPNAVLESERLKQQRELRRIDADEILDPRAQRSGGAFGG